MIPALSQTPNDRSVFCEDWLELDREKEGWVHQQGFDRTTEIWWDSGAMKESSWGANLLFQGTWLSLQNMDLVFQSNLKARSLNMLVTFYCGLAPEIQNIYIYVFFVISLWSDLWFIYDFFMIILWFGWLSMIFTYFSRKIQENNDFLIEIPLRTIEKPLVFPIFHKKR